MSAALHDLVDDMRLRYQVLEQSCPSCVPASHSPHRTRRGDGSLLVNQYAPSQYQHSQYHHVSSAAPHVSTCYSTSCAAFVPQCCAATTTCCGGGGCCGGAAYTTSCCAPVLVASSPRRHVTVVSPSRQFNTSTTSVMYDNKRNTAYTATGYSQHHQPSRAQDAQSTNNSLHGHLEALGNNNNNYANNSNSRDIADGVLNNMGMNPHTAGYDPSNYAAQNDLNGGIDGASAEDEEAEARRLLQRNSRATQRRAANGGDVEVDEKTDELREKFNLIQESGDTISADELKTILAILRRKGPSSVPDQQKLFEAASKAAGSITDHTRASHVLNISHDGSDDNTHNQTASNAHVTSATHSKYYNVVHAAEQNSQINMPKAADVMRRIGEHLDGSTTTATKARQGGSSFRPASSKSRRPIGVQKGRAAGQSRQSKIDEAGNLSTLPFEQTAILHNSSTIRAPSASNNNTSPRRAASAGGGIRSSSMGGGRLPIPSDVQGLGIRTSIPSRPADHPDAFFTGGGGNGNGGAVRAPITHQHIAGAGVFFTTGVEGRTAPTTSGSNVQAASLAPMFVGSDAAKPSRRRVLYCDEDIRRDNNTDGGARALSTGRGASWRAPHPVVQAGTCIPIATPTSERALSVGNKGKRTYGTDIMAAAPLTARAASARAKESPFDHATRGQGTRKPRDFITTLYDVKGIRTDPKYHGPESLTAATTGNKKSGRSGVLFTEVRH